MSGGDEDDKETLRIWFSRALANPIHFHLEKPLADERQGLASRHFVDYQSAIEGLGFKVWDIQDKTGDKISVVLEDSLGRQKELSGRADFIISSQSAKCQGAALQNALCVVEIQSKDDEEACEFQMMTYLVLMMNRFGFTRLAGILVCNDGTCRSYRASRALNGAIGNGAVYEQNDKFDLYQIDEILPVLLNFQ